eukprot:1530666-Amphidinium_carterae.1
MRDATATPGLHDTARNIERVKYSKVATYSKSYTNNNSAWHRPTSFLAEFGKPMLDLKWTCSSVWSRSLQRLSREENTAYQYRSGRKK